MTLREIADELVKGCREGRETENLETLYAPDAVSVEAMEMPGDGSREAKGRDAIRSKHEWWNGTTEILESTVSGPFLHLDDRFAVHFKFKARDKSSGEVAEMEEVGIYQVGDGQIVREEFFYTME